MSTSTTSNRTNAAHIHRVTCLTAAWFRIFNAVIRRQLLLMLLLFSLIATPTHAAPGDLLQSIPNPDPQEGARFGKALATLGQNIVVAATGGLLEGSPPHGRVYLINGTTSEVMLDIERPDPSSTYFGYDVAAAGINIAITDSQNVYVFDSATGGMILTIPTSRFPLIEYSKGNLLVGTVDETLLYSGTTGELIDSLDRSATEIWSVATFGDNFLVGYSDKAVVYDAQTGETLLTIVNPDSAADHKFARSVAALGNDILVGVDEAYVNGLDSAGVVQLFDGQTGQLKLTIPNPTPVEHEEFGLNVIGMDGYIAVALNQDTSPRSIEVFDADSGEYVTSIVGPPMSGAGFGASYPPNGLSLLDGNIVVGASNADVSGGQSVGSVYVFEGFTRQSPSGDTNGDQVVDLEDLNNVRNHFGDSGLGDTNADGVVDLVDLNNVRDHFGEGGASRTVPEPSGIVIVLITVAIGVPARFRRTRLPF